MALTAPTLARLRKGGIKAVTWFPAPRGAYRVREVVRELAQDRIWASTTTIEIR